METKTVLARLGRQFYPKRGAYALLTIQARGVEEGEILVERGNATDSEIELITDKFCFIKIVKNNQCYKIDKIVPVDNYLLTAELITLT